MHRDADFCVIGRGLMGTACARYLGEAGYSVVLVGPEEPAEPSGFDGPFASHHDAGRITRHLATDVDWARLSVRSIARYRDLEAQSGIAFYRAVGGMMAAPDTGPGAAFGDAFFQVAKAESIAHDALRGTTLQTRFPMFQFPAGTRAAWDPIGGWIDPRAFRRAEEVIAQRAGARVTRDTVIGRDGRVLTLGSGNKLTARHVVIATGSYAAIDGLCPAPPPMAVYARTVAFVHVTEDVALGLRAMPTLIFVPEGRTHDLYLLPPIQYPDGSWRIKIGGEDESPRLSTPVEMTTWFQGSGDADVADSLLSALADIMPALPLDHVSTGGCSVSFTDSGKPLIDRLDAGTTLLTGGNGAGAKCADELGRLGALVAMGQGLSGEGYNSSFTIEA
jgi:sarcosine oxidase